MELLFWPSLGALIGVAAAQRKGFSMVGGVIGGLLLGPLAVLMFFVSGVSSSAEQRKCPHCAEWVKVEARVCKHCQRGIPVLDGVPAQPSSSLLASAGRIIGAVVVIIVVIVGALVFLASSGSGTSTLGGGGFFGPAPVVTAAEFSQIRDGMTYQQVRDVIGAAGEQISRSRMVGITTVMYQWTNADGSNMNAMFQDDALVQKAQLGLP